MPVPGRIKIDAVLVGERFDLRVLGQVFRRSVLDVVIDRKDWLRRIRDGGRADLLELWNHSARVVMRHHVARTNRDEIAAANHRPGRQSISVSCRNLLN